MYPGLLMYWFGLFDLDSVTRGGCHCVLLPRLAVHPLVVVFLGTVAGSAVALN